MDETNWDQSIQEVYGENINYDGTIRHGTKCSMGCHVAAAIYGPLSKLQDYTGLDLVMEGLRVNQRDMTYFMACTLLHCAGTSYRPFGIIDWPTEPLTVLANLKKIKTLPPQGSFAQDHSLELYQARPDVKEWMESERSRFSS